MKTFTKIILAVITVIVALYVYYCSQFPDLGPIVSTVEIRSSDPGDVLLIKQKVWGLLGNSMAIVISKSSEENSEPDTTIEYVYRGGEFFYNFQNDTLTVYVWKKSPIPANLKTKIVVNQIVLDNHGMLDLWRRYHNNQTTGIELME